MQVRGKVVVVTGGACGIGRHVVLELLSRGARVAAVDLRKEARDELVELAGAGDRLATFPLDVTDREAVHALPEQVVAALGQVDGVVNNAGIIQPFVRLVDLEQEAIDRVLDVNLNGPIHVLKAFLPHLLRRPEAHVLNVASMGGFLPVPGQTIYCASKAAIKLLTEGLYAELLDTNVGVTCVLPGGVRTDITENSGVEVPGAAADAEQRFPVTEPEDAARQIVDGIEHDRFAVLVGKDAKAMHVASRLSTRRATELITRQMKELLPG